MNQSKCEHKGEIIRYLCEECNAQMCLRCKLLHEKNYKDHARKIINCEELTLEMVYNLQDYIRRTNKNHNKRISYELEKFIEIIKSSIKEFEMNIISSISNYANLYMKKAALKIEEESMKEILSEYICIARIEWKSREKYFGKRQNILGFVVILMKKWEK